MLALANLKVSLTKNGYIKIADVVRRHPADEIVESTVDKYDGINLAASQVRVILDAEDGRVPEYWDDIKDFGDEAIDAFTFIAILFSHHHLIETLARGAKDDFEGRVQRGWFDSNKEFTNFNYTLASLGLAPYKKNSADVRYDLQPVVYYLLKPYRLVKKLLTAKLERCGWNGRGDLAEACIEAGFHKALAMTPKEFSAWLSGDLKVAKPDAAFGLKHHNLPSTGRRRQPPK